MERKVWAAFIGKIIEALEVVHKDLNMTIAVEARVDRMTTAPAAASTAPANGEAPKKRGRPPKAATAAATEAEPDDFGEDEGVEAATDEGGDDLDSVEETPKAEITPEILRTKLVEFAQKHTKEKAYAVLAKYKAKKVAELKPETYAKVFAELNTGVN